jgi:hypothetical protein
MKLELTTTQLEYAENTRPDGWPINPTLPYLSAFLLPLEVDGEPESIISKRKGWVAKYADGSRRPVEAPVCPGDVLGECEGWQAQVVGVGAIKINKVRPIDLFALGLHIPVPEEGWESGQVEEVAYRALLAGQWDARYGEREQADTNPWVWLVRVRWTN